jgi:CRP-like cAMP-binding protein
MSRQTKSANYKQTPFTAKNLVDGQAVKNEILLALPEAERAIVFARLEFVPLPWSTKLTEKGALIKFAYFLNDGLASVLNVMANEKSIEVGLCGKEGFVGLPFNRGICHQSRASRHADRRQRIQNQCHGPRRMPEQMSNSDDYSFTVRSRDGCSIRASSCVQSPP